MGSRRRAKLRVGPANEDEQQPVGKIVAKSEELLLETRRFSVTRIASRLASNRIKHREVIRHPGSVVILPLLDEGQICLIENHRVAVDRVLIELPAGTLDAGEAPLDCARRELIEETGFRPGQLDLLTSFYAAPGILDERMHLFVARELTPGEPAREEEEEIRNRVVSWSQAWQMIDSGEIQDAKTLIGLLLYARQIAQGSSE